jgi:hypothetical protein
MAKKMPKNLFDFKLPSGKRFGDANAEELRAAADYYSIKAESEFKKGRELLLRGVLAGKITESETETRLNSLRWKS